MQKKETRKRGQREEHGERRQRKKRGEEKRHSKSPPQNQRLEFLSSLLPMPSRPTTTSPTHAHSPAGTDTRRGGPGPRRDLEGTVLSLLSFVGLWDLICIQSRFPQRKIHHVLLGEPQPSDLRMWGLDPTTSKLETILGNVREPDGFFLSAFPWNTYSLNTCSILNPMLIIMDILKNQKHDFCPKDIYSKSSKVVI